MANRSEVRCAQNDASVTKQVKTGGGPVADAVSGLPDGGGPAGLGYGSAGSAPASTIVLSMR